MNAIKLLSTTFLMSCSLGLMAQVIPVPTSKKAPQQAPPAPNNKPLPHKRPVVTKPPVAQQQRPPAANGNSFFLFDAFTDNGNDWAEASDAKKEITVGNGKLRIRGISSDYGYKSAHVFDIDNTKDLTCAVTVKWVSGVVDEPVGLDYCSNLSTNSYYNFSISANGNYVIHYYQDGKWTDIKDWTKSDAINQNSETNLLTVKQEGSYMNFYINEQRVERLQFDGGYGNTFGFRAEGTQTADFDNFTLIGTKAPTGGVITQRPVPQNTGGGGGSFDYNVYEEFNDNKNDWGLAADEDREITIANGKLRIKGISSKYGYKSVNTWDIDAGKDFMFTVAARWITGAIDEPYGIDFSGSLETKSYYNFSITANGQYIIHYLKDGNWKDLKTWTKSSYVNQNNALNMLSVKRESGYMSFFINDHLVERLAIDGFGDDFGVRSDGAQTVDFDNFSLKGSKKGSAPAPQNNGGGGGSYDYTLADDFSDNRNDWLLANTENKEIKIENGKLRIKGISNDYGYRSAHEFDVDNTKDFTVSVSARWISGVTNKTFGIVCASNTGNTSRYDFCIDADGSYQISFLDNDSWKDVKKWTHSDYINKNGSLNTLSLVKQGNYISFYVNDHQIESFAFDGGYGSVFGVTADGTQTVDFDNFTVKGTKK